MKEAIKKAIEELAKRSIESGRPSCESMQLTQAAQNLAQVLMTLGCIPK